ncbi:MAG: hypothetical protein RH860_05075 [Cytophagales bacterium]
MKNLLFLFLFFIFTAKVFAQNDYYPLKKGKTWIYQYSDDFISASGNQSRIKILEEQEIIEGKRYYVLQTSIGDENQFDVLQTSYLRNGENGLVYGLANAKMAKEHILIAEHPLEIGKTWTAEADGQKSSSVISGTNEKLITPEKTFNHCLVIETEMGDARIRSYFQKGVGLVASTLILPEGEKLMQYLVNQ